MSDFIEENKARYELWKFFSDEHGLILTEEQIEDILAASEVYKTEISEVNGAPTKDSGLHLQRVSESAITEIDKRTHDYNQKIDVVGNTNEQNITAEAKRDALDEALSIIRKHAR